MTEAEKQRRARIARQRKQGQTNTKPQAPAPLGSKLIDGIAKDLKRLVNSPVGRQVVQAQQQFVQVTNRIPGMQQLDRAARAGLNADDRLPSSRVAQGAGILAQKAAEKANVDPRLAAAFVPLLLGRVSAGGADDAAKAFRRAPSVPEPARPQVRQGNSSNIATRKNIPPNAPLPPASAQQTADQLRGQRSNLPLRQVSLEQRTAAGRGDPLSRGRTEAAVQGQYNLEETQAAGRRQRAAERPLKEGGGRNPNNIYPHATGADARPVLNRGTTGPDGQPVQRRAQRPASKPTAVAPNLADSDGIPQRRAEGDRSAWSQRLQGELVGPQAGSVPRSRRPNVHTTESQPVGRDLWASDRNPLGGRRIGGQPPTREEMRRMRKLEESGALDIPPERYRATGSRQPAEYVDAGDYRGDRFADDAGFTGDESNLGYSVKQGSASGQGEGRRGGTGAIRGQFDVKRAREDLNKAGIDPGLLNAMQESGINVNALRNPNLAPVERKEIQRQMRAFRREHGREYFTSRQATKDYIGGHYYSDKFGNQRPFESRKGSTSSTLNDQVEKFTDQTRFREQYNQIEARDNNYVELPVKKEGATDPRRPGGGKRYKSKVESRDANNVSGGMRIPQSPATEADRSRLREQRARARASEGGRGADDGGVNWKDYNQPDTQLKTEGRDRTKLRGRRPGTATSPVEGAFQDQVRRQRATERQYAQRMLIDNAFPVTMEDAVQQLRKHHGNAKAEKILNTPVGHHATWTEDGYRIKTPQARTVRDVIREQIEEQNYGNAQRAANRPGLMPRESRPISSVGPVDDVHAKGRHRTDASSVSVRGRPEDIDAARRRYLDMEPVTDKTDKPKKDKKTSTRPNRTYRDTPGGRAQQQYDEWRQDLEAGRPTPVNVSQNRVNPRQLGLDIRLGEPTRADQRLERRAGQHNGRGRLQSRPTSADRTRAYDAATDAQSFAPSAMEWEGPTFNNQRDGRRGDKRGKVTVAPTGTKDGRMPNDFTPDGEVRGVSTRGRSTRGNRNEVTSEETKRRAERAGLRERASKTKKDGTPTKKALEAQQQLQETQRRQQAEMERIRAERARRRGGR